MIGVDEVGRGAWAGPLLVCAARLRGSIVGLKDSKKLTKLQRERLAPIIENNADIGYGWVPAAEIDKHGLVAALRMGALRAVTALSPGENEPVIIDGTVNFLPERANVTMIPKADDLVAEVSAASIVAKVARDKYMTKMSLQYPHYGFSSHVGYGTKAHQESIKQNGLCDEHRKSFKIPAL